MGAIPSSLRGSDASDKNDSQRPPDAPPPRRLIELDAANETRDCRSFSLLTYNILAQMYWSQDFEAYCPPFARSREYRLNNVMNEIKQQDPDFVCLQEVDCYEGDVYPMMKAMGYEGEYQKRKHWHPDGCAIFYKQDKCKLLAKAALDLNDIADVLHPHIIKNPRRFQKNNVALFCLFEEISEEGQGQPARICVATTHLYWSPDFNDVKIIQMHRVVDALCSFRETHARTRVQQENKDKESDNDDRDHDYNIPVVLAGDFNSMPDSSPVRLVLDGRLDHDNVDYKKYAFDGIHSMPLASAYAALGHPPTNFTPKFTACIDYVFYCADSLVLTHLLEGIDTSVHPFTVYRSALPNPWYSSDHICLCARFAIKQRKKSDSNNSGTSAAIAEMDFSREEPEQKMEDDGSLAPK